MKSTITIAIFFVTLSACGVTNSGVEGSKRADALTAKERTALCAWLTTELGGPDTDKECGGGETASVFSVAHCEYEATHTSCSVRQIEDCVQSLKGDLCALSTSTVCAECALGIAVSVVD